MVAVGVAVQAPRIGMKAGVDELDPVEPASRENGSTPTPELLTPLGLIMGVKVVEDAEDVVDVI